MQKKSTLMILLVFLIPSTLFAVEDVKSGYDLYHNLKLMDNPQSPEDITTGFLAVGYLMGCIDGLIFMQDTLYNAMFPPKVMSAEERSKFSKKMNFNRLNFPEKGIPVGQMILIFNKYSENHPEELNNTARVCILGSLIEAYGWK